MLVGQCDALCNIKAVLAVAFSVMLAAPVSCLLVRLKLSNAELLSQQNVLGWAQGNFLPRIEQHLLQLKLVHRMASLAWSFSDC